LAYTSGNLALQPKRKPEQQPVKETKTVVKVRRMIPPAEMLRYLFSVAVIVGLVVLIIFRYAQDYRMQLQIKTMDATYAESVVDMKVLQAELAKLNDPDRIRAMAIAQGMIEPEQAGTEEAASATTGR